MIQFNHVSIGFDNKEIINDFSARVEKNQHVCLMGKSGTGKSSLLTTVVAFTIPNKGEIIVDTLPLNTANVAKVRSRIAWVPQEINLPYEFVRETINSPYLLKVNKHLSLDKDRMFHLFSLLGLDSKIYDQRMQEISGGEKQRLMLVSALMLDREIVMLDEPTSALDTSSRKQLTDLLKTMTNTTILAVTHDSDLAHTFDKTITINKS